MREDIELLSKRAIKECVFPGCAIGIVRSDGKRTVLPFGHLTYETSSQKVDEHTVYDIASLTKSIPTASLSLTLIAEGALGLADAITDYAPELRNDHGVTIEDLLRYRARGVQLSQLKDETADEITAQVLAQGFDGPPGESVYTNLPAFLLGLVIERVTGASLDVLAQRHFFDPFRMEKTSFVPHARPTRSNVAPTEIGEDEKEIRGIVHDESARVFANADTAVGHAGLFSTAGDLLEFLEALLRGKLPAVLEGAQKGLGWQVNDSRFMGKHAHELTFGKTGFTGTSVVCDVKRGFAFVILSNRTYPKRPPNDEAISSFRRDIADTVFDSL